MDIWQTYFLLAFASTSFILSIRGWFESTKKKTVFGGVHTFLIGAYVWGDAVVFGVFWGLVSLISLLFQDFVLFCLVMSLFWVVRSFGETIYWLNEQYNNEKRVNIKKKALYKYFKNDSVLFVYQITQQCITVVALVASIYFANLWLKQF